jgi:small-conductance mechanosensitive channel
MNGVDIGYLPPWAYLALWSFLAILFSIIAGRIVTAVLCGKLARWASKTAWKWDDLVVDALRSGLPFWSFLLGCYIAIGFWELPPHLLQTLIRALYVFGWISVTMIAAGTAGRLVMLYGSHFQHTLPVTSLTENIAKLLIVILGLLMILNGMGISITPMLTALGVGGLAVALALQDTLSNLFSGFYLTVARHVRVGDYVKLDSGEEGYVMDIGWRATTIRALPNNMIIVPNNKLGGAILTNYYLPDTRLAVLVEVGVDYASDLDKVERVTCEVARETLQGTAGGVAEFQPFIRFHTFGEYSIDFTVILQAKEFVDQYLVKHEFVKRLHLRYAKEGITIPFPTRTVLTRAD